MPVPLIDHWTKKPAFGAFPFLNMNLASQPFRRERVRIAALSAVCGALLVLLLPLSAIAIYRYEAAQDVRRGLERENAGLNRLEEQRRGYTNVLAESQNADIFSWSVFDNQIIARRSIAWSRVFGDLASVMPDHMRLVGIRSPQVHAGKGATNHVQLDVVVAADEPDVVISFLKNLQQSSLFGPAKVMSRTPPAEHEPEYKFRVLVAYAQDF